MLKLQVGLLNIPITAINLTKSRYSDKDTALHLFSSCCKFPVGNKRVCKGCGKEVSKEEVFKGTDKDNILSLQQQETLKQALESGTIEVVGIKDITETTFYDLIPFVVKAEAILPSISDFKKADIKTFYSFKEGLKELNKYCLVKKIQRNTEHIGILLNWKDDLIFIEIPFKHYSNFSKIESAKSNIIKLIEENKVIELEGFKEQAKQFLEVFKSKVGEIDEMKEEKRLLLKQLLEDVEKGETETKIEINEKNPFAI
jgi:non-homologous end joining protein Ku